MAWNQSATNSDNLNKQSETEKKPKSVTLQLFPTEIEKMSANGGLTMLSGLFQMHIQGSRRSMGKRRIG